MSQLQAGDIIPDEFNPGGGASNPVYDTENLIVTPTTHGTKIKIADVPDEAETVGSEIVHSYWTLHWVVTNQDDDPQTLYLVWGGGLTEGKRFEVTVPPHQTIPVFPLGFMRANASGDSSDEIQGWASKASVLVLGGHSNRHVHSVAPV